MNRKTEIISLEAPDAIDLAADIIQAGGVIAFPTDTVYGIGVSAFKAEAIEKIYQVKGRSSLKAIPILINSAAEADLITPELEESVQKIIKHFWPGALTLVLPLLPGLPKNLSPTPTIGLRVPDHTLTRDLLLRTGPLAATSANLSGQPSALTAEEVRLQLDGRIDLILDGGPSPGGQASTVLDCTGDKLNVLREGPIDWETIREILT
jgi:L-threonylcarbamoyladenylate synthase